MTAYVRKNNTLILTNNTKKDIDSVLDEYTRLTKSIDNIKRIIADYKTHTESRMPNTEFESFIESLKSNAHITEKYRLLKQRQKELREIIIQSSNSSDSFDSSNVLLKKSENSLERTIEELKLKYESKINLISK